MFRRYALQSALALAAAATLAGCSSMGSAPATLDGTIAKTPSLSTFSKLAVQAGLTDTLKAAGPYTVFAPSDDAFKAVPAKTLAELQANPAQLKAVLSHHIVAGRVTAAEAKAGNAKTLNGSNVALARAGAFVTVDEAMVTQADVIATNGVVHVVDTVLMPPKK
ncbi:fasciclin domain-containing protein [Acidovorax sp. Root217]|uniref:fasciclin domain-containing protein n=1 Tax=Acidovorax sp. Root217 TaxID=1736492 RepID=UPI000708CC20|nr:fasciclin domain-containing protein [Acidovorax sp. Root217]KRC14730.1 fasciclin [Acidovorax sp. Root217]